MMRWLQEWTKPAGLMILLGGIVWGVQLNYGLITALATNDKQDLIQQEILSKQVTVSNNVQQSTILLNLLMVEMKALRDKVDSHQMEAEMWKERIRQNGDDIETFGE